MSVPCNPRAHSDDGGRGAGDRRAQRHRPDVSASGNTAQESRLTDAGPVLRARPRGKPIPFPSFRGLPRGPCCWGWRRGLRAGEDPRVGHASDRRKDAPCKTVTGGCPESSSEFAPGITQHASAAGGAPPPPRGARACRKRQPACTPVPRRVHLVPPNPGGRRRGSPPPGGTSCHPSIHLKVACKQVWPAWLGGVSLGPAGGVPCPPPPPRTGI